MRHFSLLTLLHLHSPARQSASDRLLCGLGPSAADTAWPTLRWAPSAGPVESAQLLQARAELAERAKAQALLEAAARSAVLKHQEAQVGQSGSQLSTCSPSSNQPVNAEIIPSHIYRNTCRWTTYHVPQAAHSPDAVRRVNLSLEGTPGVGVPGCRGTWQPAGSRELLWLPAKLSPAGSGVGGSRAHHRDPAAWQSCLIGCKVRHTAYVMSICAACMLVQGVKARPHACKPCAALSASRCLLVHIQDAAK